MRNRLTLQPTFTAAAATTQEDRYARPLGHAVSGVALVNVYRNTSGTSVTFTLQTASQLGVSSSFWTSVGTGNIGAGTSGMVKIVLTDLGEWIRWDLSGLNAAIDFDIVLELDDRKADP
jgi:hypothetical protein